MKKLRKISIIALFVALISALAFAVTACGEKIDGISIDQSNLPQLTFVQGQELNLSGGKLTVQSDGNTSDIALDSPEVTVSGYDKDKLGSQELTVEYKGFTTMLTVTVAARMVVENAETEYFVGEQFNTNVGRIKITRDDGSALNVQLNNSAVTLTGFDSSTAGVKTISVSYADGSAQYGGSFTAEVFEVAEVKLTKPRTGVCYSHETSFDVSGGYFTLKNSSGTLQRNVTLTQDMLGQYDFSTVGAEYRNEPYQMTLTATYAGKKIDFTVNVYYSDVSLIRDAAAQLLNLDWSQSKAPAITENQGKTALEAAECLIDLSIQDDAFISKTEREAVIRAAAVYGYNVWLADFQSYSNTFFINSIGEVVFNPDESSFATAKADYDRLYNGTNTAVYKVGSILISLIDKYADCTLYNDYTIELYLGQVYDPNDLKNILLTLSDMLSLYEAFASVPAWQAIKDFSKYYKEVETARAVLVDMAANISADDRYIYGIVSSWRGEDNDYFEILYRYYYEMYKSGNAAEVTEAINAFRSMINVRLPGVLEDFYQSYYDAAYEYQLLQYYDYYGFFIPAEEIDTVWFIQAYGDVLEAKDAVYATADTDTMYIDLYALFAMDNNLNILKTAVDNLAVFMLDDSAYESLWNNYFKVLSLYDANNKGEYETELIALFKEFVNATPSCQMGFLASINAYATPEFFPSDETGRSTLFTGLILNYLFEIFPTDLFYTGTDENQESGLIMNLFTAMQCYILRNYNTEDELYLDDFLLTMGKAVSQYETLQNTSDKTVYDNFNKYVGFLYNKYASIYERFDLTDKIYVQKDEDKVSIPEEWQAKLDELQNCIMQVSVIQIYIEALGTNQYPALISAAERAEVLAQEIMSCNVPAVLEKFNHVNVFIPVTDDDGNTEDVSIGTLEYAYYTTRNYYINYLRAFPNADKNGSYDLWDMYRSSTQLRKVVAGSLYDFLWAKQDVTDLEMKNIMLKVTQDFRSLSENDKELFLILDGNGTFQYFKVLKEYYKNVFTVKEEDKEVLNETVYNIAVSLIDFECDLVMKYDDTTSEAENAAKQAIKSAYEALSETDKELFNEYLQEMYNAYIVVDAE